ncbi:MAG: lipoate--protein ligase [Firmicutes bacterium HGW-Firmicutes-20]|jgi:lipoate-protein ligase A|nr:MAG: lipoate--protein ligase [Firmicutes bacterium HGW-Firmicutes-20]PKM90709.1 MAG: lipoate--protein ligase [Firmicutes bacterium HGW-Firmicutes-10]
MRYLINKSTNPYFNLALDEYALKHINLDEDFFFLWRNEPSVIIGKNQNTVEEINQAFVDKNSIKVARRVSGGGAVYHDLGNLNFTFIINVDDPGEVNYKKYVQPVIDALQEMGVKAEASGRNDILINGLKISGNAQRMANKKLMHHGTLLYDVNIEDLVQALHVTPDKYISKGVKSVRSRVTNIKEHLPDSTDIFDFWNSLHFFLSNKGKDKEIVLSEKEIAKIEFEAVNRFATWDWIYGKSPEFNFVNKKRFKGGNLEIKADVRHGHIQSIHFSGDYLGLNDVNVIEERLRNVRFLRVDVEHILSDYDLSMYFNDISKEEFLSLMFD